MLHRSFKPAKCKTALKLAVSRIKLLKNKKDGQVKQIKAELAQLLENGQDRTARIRVEHVVREEKTRAAYELVEIYCELIATRLPIIESQKNCPIDLKEAISSVIFASPRCADIPELMDVRKHFAAKYGKEFISAAVELRPDCGVSRMLVEKLSTKSPDGPTKMKILTAIAEEYKVKWVPDSSEENDSKFPEDLLNGPNTYGMASKIPVEPPRGPPPPNRDDKEPPNVQLPHKNYENHDVSMNFNEQNARPLPSFQDAASTNISANKATTSGTFHPEVRSSETETDRMVPMHPFPGDGNTYSSSRQNWNMQFKDAASAAQAAAESAEQASMAARAAAELSRQYSSESHNKFSQSAPLETSTTSINNPPSVNSFQMADRYPPKKSTEPEKHDFSSEVSIKRESGKSDIVQASEMQAGIKPEKHDFSSEVRVKRQSGKSEVMQAGTKHENVSSFGDIRSEKKSSRSSSRSNSSFGSDDQENVLRGSEHINYFADMGTEKQSIRSYSPSHSRNLSNNHENVSNGPGGDSFVSDVNIHESTKGMNSFDNAALVFDDSGSDDDNIKFDVDNYKEQESSLLFSSPGRNSFSIPSSSLNAWSNEQKTDEIQFKSISQLSSSSVQHSHSVFSESSTGSMVSSKPTDLLAVAFDASDGPSSDSEEEVDTSKLVRSTDSKLSHGKNVHSTNSGQSQSKSHRSLGSSSYADVHPERTQGVEYSAFLKKKFDYDELPTGQPSPRMVKYGLDTNVKDDFQTPQLPQTLENNEFSNEYSCGSDNELNFGVLTGGLRNKGYKHPPYGRKPSGNSLLGKQVTEDTKIDQSSYSPTVRTSIVSRTSDEEPYNWKGSTKLNKERSTRTPALYVAADDDSSEDELPHETLSSSRQDPHNQKSPYARKPSGNSLSGKQVTEDTKIDQSSYPPTVRTSIVSRTSDEEPYNRKGSTKIIKERSTRTPVTYVAAADDSSEDELPHETLSSSRQDPHNQKSGSEVKASSRSTFNYFDSGDSESENDLPKKFSTSIALPSTKFSRRTQRSSLKSGRNSSSKTSVPSEASGTLDYGKPSSRSSYATETLPKPSSQSQTKSSERSGSQEWHRPVQQATPKPIPESKKSYPRVETSKSLAREQSSDPPKIVREQSSNPPKIVREQSLGSTEASKSSGSTVETAPKEKASHVHPKLPDSDDIIAKFMALRKSRE